MSAESKLAKKQSLTQQATDKLLDLVSSKAKKKKILQQVSKIQELEKASKKLAKKVKKQPKAKAPKIVKEQAEAVVKEVKTSPTAETSTNFNAREAIKVIRELQSKDEVTAFASGDSRKTVQDAAQARLNSLQE